MLAIPGDRASLAQGYMDRFSCSDQNHWVAGSSPQNLSESDPRFAYIFLTSWGRIVNARQNHTEFPIRAFLRVYVTGWTRQGGGPPGPETCAGNEQPPEPFDDQGNRAQLWGHFVDVITLDHDADLIELEGAHGPATRFREFVREQVALVQQFVDAEPRDRVRLDRLVELRDRRGHRVDVGDGRAELGNRVVAQLRQVAVRAGQAADDRLRTLEQLRPRRWFLGVVGDVVEPGPEVGQLLRDAVVTRLVEQLLDALPRAMATLLDPVNCGPATLAFCQDVQAEAFDYPRAFFERRVWRVRRPEPEARDIEALASALKAAKAPLIIAGGGVLYAGAEATLERLAETTGVPVAETQAGKGALAWDHPAALGSIGVTGSSAANEAAARADLVIGVGTRLQDFTSGSRTLFERDGCKLIQV